MAHWKQYYTTQSSQLLLLEGGVGMSVADRRSVCLYDCLIYYLDLLRMNFDGFERQLFWFEFTPLRKIQSNTLYENVPFIVFLSDYRQEQLNRFIPTYIRWKELRWEFVSKLFSILSLNRSISRTFLRIRRFQTYLFTGFDHWLRIF